MSPHLKKMKSHREELLDDSIFGPGIKTLERGKHKEIECSEKREKLHDLLKNIRMKEVHCLDQWEISILGFVHCSNH